jgi:hypothetical protein
MITSYCAVRTDAYMMIILVSESVRAQLERMHI